MKHFLLSLILWLGTVGCQKSLKPDNVLYRTWSLSTVLYDGQNVDAVQYIHLVTFPRNGNFRDGQPDDSRWCCTPSSFIATNRTLRFIWDGSNPICAQINCRMSPLTGDVTWQIETLTTTSLVLKNDKHTLTFIATP